MKTDLSMFDPMQRSIITENSGRDIVVGASAGAGKTMVLVSRILKRCMDDRINVSRILALTFTSAAAEEMKNRLSRQFHELREKTDDEEEKAYIDSQITQLVNADITTIDSYCLSIIQRFSAVIGLDPASAQNILSEGKNEQLQTEAFRLSMNQLADTPEGFENMLALCQYFSPRPEDYSRLYQIVKTINLHAQSAVDPKEWYQRCRENYIPFSTIRQLPDAIRNAWFDLLGEECGIILEYAASIHEKITEEPDKKIKPEMIIQTINLFNHAMECIKDQDYDGYLVLLKDAAVNKIPKSADIETELMRTIMHDHISHLLEISYEQYAFARNSALHTQIVHSLIDLAELTSETFAALKRSISAMNFSDMERYALQILKASDARIALKLNHSFDEIMIDEFQDTSYLQDTILTTIAKADRSIPVFRVGDVKQSIYRFRQAKPELMRRMMADPDTAVFNMLYNYRSDKGIVAFTNLLFERLMNVAGSSDHYGDEDHVDIGTPRQDVRNEEPAVQLVLLKDAVIDEDGKKKKLPAAEAKKQKAQFISEKICQMISESDGALSFRDFAVLSRSHADQIVLRNSFDVYHIPYDIDAREGFYLSDLCQDILNIARVLRDPYDEVALCAVLTSPLFSFNDEQLAEARIKGDSFAQSIYQIYPEIYAQFEQYRTIMNENGMEALLSTIANTPVTHEAHEEEICFYDALSRKDQANFDYLFDLTVSANVSSLSALIREMELGEAENSSEAITTGKGDDVVTVTTIHHSKGLQYKIVFLWGGSGNKFSDGREAVLIDDDLMLGIRDIDSKYRIALPTVQRLCVEHRINKDDLDEFTRVLYVAVTRAQKQLIIVDNEDAEQEKRRVIDYSALDKRSGITGLITMALDHEDSVTEGGLLKTLHVDFSPSSEEYAWVGERNRIPKPEKLPRLCLKEEPLPEIRTPSSLEKSRSLLSADSGKPVLPSFAPKNTGGMNYGTMMHKACEDMPDDQEWTRELLRSVMDPSLNEKALNDLYLFGHSDLYERCRKLEIHKEYPFYFEDESARINGTIDLAAVSEKKIIIIDFKTDRMTPAEIAEEYSPQLNTYRSVMASFYPDADIELYAWSFYNGTAVPIEKAGN